MADLNEFQSKIGYTFKNRHLLEQALTARMPMKST